MAMAEPLRVIKSEVMNSHTYETLGTRGSPSHMPTSKDPSRITGRTFGYREASLQGSVRSLDKHSEKISISSGKPLTRYTMYLPNALTCRVRKQQLKAGK